MNKKQLFDATIGMPFWVAAKLGESLPKQERFNASVDWITNRTAHEALEKAKKKGTDQALDQKHEQGLKSITQALVTYRESFVPRTREALEDLEAIAKGQITVGTLTGRQSTDKPRRNSYDDYDDDEGDTSKGAVNTSKIGLAEDAFEKNISPAVVYDEIRQAIQIRYDALVMDFGAPGSRIRTILPSGKPNPLIPEVTGKTPAQVAADIQKLISDYSKFLSDNPTSQDPSYNRILRKHVSAFESMDPFEREMRVHSLARDSVPLFKQDIDIFIADVPAKVKDAHNANIKRGAQIVGGVAGLGFIAADLLTGGGNTLQLFEALHNVPLLGGLTQLIDNLPLIGDIIPGVVDLGALGATTALASGTVGAALAAPKTYIPLAQEKSRHAREEALTERKALDAINTVATDLMHDINLAKGRLSERRSIERREGNTDKVDGIISAEARKETIEEMAKGLK